MSSSMPDPCAWQPVILSVAGDVLSGDEARLFETALPAGFILFSRNCVHRVQLKKLCDDLRECVGWHCPILIDQEGGRVMRLKPPEWPDLVAARDLGACYEDNPAQATAIIDRYLDDMASTLREVGIDVNCAPVLDVATRDMTDAIGSRAYGFDPACVGTIGHVIAAGMITRGITPVIKHMPGHGRAVVDSHALLPRVDACTGDLAACDWVPFRQVAAGLAPASLWGMSAHVVYEAIDPVFPATLSPAVIGEVIREAIGFAGVLVTDDLSMKALDSYGYLAERAEKSLHAGCDLALYCAGVLTEMVAITDRLPPLGDQTAERLTQWMYTSRKASLNVT